jgi:hypothetical protein
MNALGLNQREALCRVKLMENLLLKISLNVGNFRITQEHIVLSEILGIDINYHLDHL